MNITITDEQAILIISALFKTLDQADMKDTFEFGPDINKIVKKIIIKMETK